MTNVRRTFIDGPFGQVHCRIAEPKNSDANAIVCLHMSPKSSRSYAELMPFLADNRTSLAPDYPGHGESDLPPAEPHITVPDFARSTWAAIDALTNGPVHLIGYHTGSMVAVEAAHQQPERVSSIINISAPIMKTEELASAQETYLPIPIDEAGNRFSIMWERVLAHRGPGMTLQMAAASFAENLRAGDDYEWGHRAAFNYGPEYINRLGALQHPFLLMNPNDDCFELSQRADKLIPNVDRRDYLDWGHGFMSAYPEAVSKIILEFVGNVEARN